MELLRVNGTAVLNFLDLQSRFSPLSVYGQLETLDRFAAVHCVPLPLQLTGAGDGKKYVAKYLTKEFWHGMARRAQWPEQVMDVQAWSDFILSCARERAGEDAGEDGPEREAADSGLTEKLDFIVRSAGAEREGRKAVVLLALCELAEVDPRKTAPEDWRPAQDQKDAQAAPGPFLYEQTAHFTADGQVRRYWYYDAAELKPGDKLRTVRVEAADGGNQYARVKLELYSRRTGQCVRTLTLGGGEFCFCTAVGDQIAAVLPSVSLSDELCLTRPDYGRPAIRVRARDGEAWELNAERVSCFAAGGREQGFLLVQEGKVNSKFYKPAQDYLTRLQLEMIPLPVVEVRIGAAGYELLLEDGTTRSAAPGGERTGVVTLARPDMGAAVKDLPRVREAVLSDSGESLAVLYGTDEERICFAGEGGKVCIREDGSVSVIE